MSFTQHLESWQKLILQRSQPRFVYFIENREPKKLRLPVPCWRSSDVPWGCAHNCPVQHGAASSAKALRESCTYLVPDPGALQVIMLGRVQLTSLFWRSLEVCQGGVCFRGLKMMLVRAAKRERPRSGVLDEEHRQISGRLFLDLMEIHLITGAWIILGLTSAFSGIAKLYVLYRKLHLVQNSKYNLEEQQSSRVSGKRVLFTYKFFALSYLKMHSSSSSKWDM